MKKTNLNPGVYSELEQNWINAESNGDSNTGSDSLTILTYNVWFSDEHVDTRSKALFTILNESDADIIALQEVTYHFLQLLLMQKWLRENYFISDFWGNSFSSYGIILLSRLPIKYFSTYLLPSQMERRLLVAELSINHITLKIATVHLESTQQAMDIRVEQLSAIFPALDNTDCSILMGDFNFSATAAEENNSIDNQYIDLWHALRGAEHGHTLNTDINTMLFKGSQTHIKSRIDRMLLRQASNKWEFSSIKLLGTQPVPASNVDIFPSDHFGLLCKLEWLSE